MDLNCVNSTKQIVRPLAKFHPDIWGDRFLNYTPPDEVPFSIVFTLIYVIIAT